MKKAILLSFVLLPLWAMAQVDSVNNLQEVLVLGKKVNTEVIKPQTLTSKELKNLNSLNVSDALRYFAGVQIKDYGGIGGIKTVNIRSMGTNHVGVFLDGVQLANVQNGQVDLGQFSLANLESISLYNGQKSQIFQAARDFSSSGSIYLVTRRPTFGNKSYHLNVSLRRGSFNLINPFVGIDLKLSPLTSMSLSTEWVSSSGEYKFRYRRKAPRTGEIVYDTTAVRHNGDIRALHTEASLFGSLFTGEYFIKLYNYTSERGIPGAIVNNVWRRGERQWDNNSFAQFRFTKSLDKHSFKLQSKYAYYLTKYVNKDTTVVMIDNLYKQKEFYLSTAYLYQPFDIWSISASYDFLWNKMDAEMLKFPYPRRMSHFASVASSLSLGNLHLQASLVANFVKDKIKLIQDPKNKTSYAPAFIASWQFLPWLSVNGFYKKSFRMPTFNDLYYAEIGNSKLNPEYTTQYDLGLFLNKNFKGFVKNFSLRTDAYYNKVKDKIIAYPKGQQFRWTMLNLGEVQIKGIDALMSVTVSPLKDWTITSKFQYTYQQAIDVTNPTDTYYKDQIPYIPHHSGSAIIQSSYKGWNLNYSFIYTGERYNQQENIIYNYTQPWYTSDMSLMKEFKIKDVGYRVQLEVLNLFAQDYDVILNYPMPKRNYRITLNVTL